jgi:iron(III) transport system ATP-binding protein
MNTVPAKSLEIIGLSKTYPMQRGHGVPAVRDFTLTVAPGEFVTLLGPSGCGKTTVLRTLAGLEEPDAGEILLDGRSIVQLPAHRRRIGLVFQNYALFPHLSVFENVAYSLRIRKAIEDAIQAEVPAALHAVGMEGLGDRLPGQLSGGQQQRVALARALVMKPDLLLFDEPLSNLDAKLRVQVRGELRRLQKRLGTTAIYVTHDQDEAMSLSDRIAVMNAGQVEQVGAPQDIYARPASLFVASFVGQVNALAGHVTSHSDGHANVEVLGHRYALSVEQTPPANVLVLARPEAIRLGRDTAHRGIVEDFEYRGDRIEYRIRVGDVLLIAIEPALGHRGRVVAGDQVRFELAADALHLLPATAEK